MLTFIAQDMRVFSESRIGNLTLLLTSLSRYKSPVTIHLGISVCHLLRHQIRWMSSIQFFTFGTGHDYDIWLGGRGNGGSGGAEKCMGKQAPKQSYESASNLQPRGL